MAIRESIAHGTSRPTDTIRSGISERGSLRATSESENPGGHLESYTGPAKQICATTVVPASTADYTALLSSLTPDAAAEVLAERSRELLERARKLRELAEGWAS